jgi:hypothetical protein
MTQLPVDRLIVVKFMIHPVFRLALTSDMRGTAVIGFSYSDIVDYNTKSQASNFFIFLLPAVFGPASGDN